MAGHWINVQIPEPKGKFGHAMAYDDVRERIVLFSGPSSNKSESSETWEWNGKAWTLVATFGPSVRSNLDAAYNPDSGCVVIFGGEISANSTAKTAAQVIASPWEWNGKGWKELPDFGADGRRHGRIAYDTARKRLVVFGGSDRPGISNPVNPLDAIANPDPRTWEWDGRGWSVRAFGGPRPRYGHAMAFDAARKRVVLFGGAYDELTKDKKPSKIVRYLGDTWEWDGQAWTQVSNIGPAPRYLHSMAYDCDRGRMVLFGGEVSDDPELSTEQNIPNETWEWDGNGWMQVADSGPGHFVLTCLAYDKARKQMVLMGGMGKGLNMSLWIWNP